MKKVIFFSALLIIITLLSSCNNSERYHFTIDNRSRYVFVWDSKTGKVYFTTGTKYMRVWDPIKKTLTLDSLKSENQDVASDYQPSDTDGKGANHATNDISKKYTIEQLGQLVKKKYPKEYGSMGDSAAGKKLLSVYPVYKQYLKKEVRRKK